MTVLSVTRRRRWAIAIYATVFVPVVGPALLIVGSSIAYYRWRGRCPSLARWINTHAWIALGLNVLGQAILLKLAHG